MFPAKTAAAIPASNRTFTGVAPAVVFLLAVLALALLGGCANKRGGAVPYEVQGFGTPDAPPVLTIEEDYKIAPLDTLKVAVFQVPDLSGDFEVDLTGNIAMPLIGNIKAVDMTTRQLQAHLVQRLGDRYLQSPDVSVGVKSSTRRNVTVDGSVRQPGLFPVTGPMTLMQAIAMARGTDENANPRRIAIFRQISGQRMAAAFDLTDIRRGSAEDPQIYSGDIIIVDGSSTKQAQREILQALPLLRIFQPLIY